MAKQFAHISETFRACLAVQLRGRINTTEHTHRQHTHREEYTQNVNRINLQQLQRLSDSVRQQQQQHTACPSIRLSFINNRLVKHFPLAATSVPMPPLIIEQPSLPATDLHATVEAYAQSDKLTDCLTDSRHCADSFALSHSVAFDSFFCVFVSLHCAHLNYVRDAPLVTPKKCSQGSQTVVRYICERRTRIHTLTLTHTHSNSTL